LTVPDARADRLRRFVIEAIALPGVESAAIFLANPSGGLELGASIGVVGPALERLVEAVQNPGHPIARTMADGVASFDAMPTAPGGPALRSHLPLLIGAADPARRRVIGVLAVAHDLPLDAEARASLQDLALAAARAAS
jgi:hypothetical protein